jgi:hypothetical protein
MGENKEVLDETNEFLVSIRTEAFFLLQALSSRKLIKNANSVRMKEKLETQLKKLADKAVQKKEF